MKKLLHFFLFCGLAFVCFYLGSLAADRQVLSDQWIRIHVVAASDSQEDQQVKLQVRNGLLSQLEQQLEGLDTGEAANYLEGSLPQLEQTAREILRSCGSPDTVRVGFREESFPRRSGDGFRLPAGVYKTLRVTIGEGKGHNWWGVLFPQTWQEETVSTALTEEETPKLRFFFLEKLGQLQAWIQEQKCPDCGTI